MIRACIFIDGENLRYSIDNLFTEYSQSHYIPYADWDNFLHTIIELSSRKIKRELNLIRAYWYVISYINYDTKFKSSSFKKSGIVDKLEYFKKFAPSKSKSISFSSNNETLSKVIIESENLLKENSKQVDDLLHSWKEKESIIQRRTNLLQFQKFGFLKIALDNGYGKVSYKEEKGVDIKMATDLMILKDIYDVAIIVTGDGDFVPAVRAIKNMGKQVIMVDFKAINGQCLPGGSWKLKEHCDFDFSILYKTMFDICRYGMEKKEPPKIIDLDSEYDF